jgi:hypothetical protein
MVTLTLILALMLTLGAVFMTGVVATQHEMKLWKLSVEDETLEELAWSGYGVSAHWARQSFQLIRPVLVDPTKTGPRVCQFRVEYTLMFDQNIDIVESESKSLRHKQAQAMLDLFEVDRGRAAVTLDEIKEWASSQQDDELCSRVERLVSQSIAAPDTDSIW